MMNQTPEQKLQVLQEKFAALEKKHNNLVDKTRRMRGYQVAYFRYRAKSDLDMSKRIEREVDALIASEVQQMKSKQEELF